MRLTDMRRLKGQYLILAATGVCAALTAAVYIGGIRPLMGRQEDFASRQAKIQSLQKRRNNLSAQLTALTDKVSVAKKALTETPLKLQPARKANSRLAGLDNLAAGCDVELDQTALGASMNGPEYRMIPINLSGKAQFRNFAIFLHRLREECSDMAVWSMELSRPAEETPEQVTFRIRVIWFTAIDPDGKT